MANDPQIRYIKKVRSDELGRWGRQGDRVSSSPGDDPPIVPRWWCLEVYIPDTPHYHRTNICAAKSVEINICAAKCLSSERSKYRVPPPPRL